MQLSGIPSTALQISFFQFCTGKQLPSGWLHEKTVPYIAIAQSLHGQYEILFQGSSSQVKAPAAFLAPSNTPLRIIHHPDRQGRFVARWLHLSCTIFHAIDLSDLLVMPRHLEGPAIKHLNSIFEDSLKPSHALAEAAARNEAAWRTVRLLLEVSQLRSGTDRLLHAGERLRPLLSHLNACLTEKISVAQMAGIAGLSPSRLFAFFRENFFCTPQQYLKRLRLDTAATLLLSTDAPLKEIASRSGFANPFHLSREFRERFGVSPKLYRHVNFKASL